jgi:multimeric flavodoxin WrbA
MHSLIENMKRSEVWVQGTPVYWWGSTAQFKTFIDRWYGLKREMFKGKRVILAIPLGGGSESYARHTTGMLTDILDYLGVEHYESLIATGSHSRGSIRGRSGLMNRARETVGRQSYP